jgi:hypothetical protein
LNEKYIIYKYKTKKHKRKIKNIKRYQKYTSLEPNNLEGKKEIKQANKITKRKKKRRKKESRHHQN